MYPRLLRPGALVLAAAAFLLPARASAQPEVVALTRRAGPAVVMLKTFSAAGRNTGLGSGFFLPDGRIATNRHVVEGAARIDVIGADERNLGSVQYAEAVGAGVDLAILPRIGTVPASLRVATALPDAGEQVLVIGAPEGLSNTISTGIVSAVRRMNGRTLVQISAPISHGSSGGPVLNMRGEVIGVSVSMLSEGQNLNFAVPSTDLNALTRESPRRIAFTDNLRGNTGTGGSGDISGQNRSRLPRITSGQTVTGRLAEGDFVLSDASFADSYVYTGRAGEQLTVTLRSSDFDAFVMVDDPNGPMRDTDDDSGGGLDSELSVTLPHSGEYLIVANSVAGGATGRYTMTVRSGGAGGAGYQGGGTGGGEGTITDLGRRTLRTLTSGQTVNGRFGPGSFVRSDDNTYADGYAYNGRAGETITIRMQSSAFDSWVVLDDPNGPLQEFDDDGGGGNNSALTITLPHAGRYVIVANQVSRSSGAYTLSVTSGGGGGGNVGGGQPGGTGTIADLGRRSLRSLSNGQSVNGRLGPGSFLRSDDNTWADGYAYNARAGETVTFSMESRDFDSWLVVDDPNGPLREHDDDSGGGRDAELTVTLPHAGRYVIVANEVSRQAGSYTLRVTSGGGGGGNDDDDAPASGGGADFRGLNRRTLPRLQAGQIINGQLSRSDFRRNDGSYADVFVYQGRAGERLTLTLASADFDAWLVLDEPDGPFEEHDDDSAGGNNSRLSVRLPTTTTYLIVVNSVSPNATGGYRLSVQSQR
jgi:hypothetical protein